MLATQLTPADASAREDLLRQVGVAFADAVRDLPSDQVPAALARSLGFALDTLAEEPGTVASGVVRRALDQPLLTSLFRLTRVDAG